MQFNIDICQIDNALVFSFDEDLSLKDGQFGNINTIFFVTSVTFETSWVMAIKRFGRNKAPETALVL